MAEPVNATNGNVDNGSNDVEQPTQYNGCSDTAYPQPALPGRPSTRGRSQRQRNVANSALFVSTIDDSDEFSLGDLQPSRQGLGYSTNNTSKRPSTDIEPLAATEERAVSCLRIVVVAVLVLAGILVGVLVYLVAADSDQENFRRQYDTHANQILEAFNENVNLKLGALESLAVSAASFAGSQSATGSGRRDDLPYIDGEWPFVTLPDFAPRAQTSRALGQALFVGMCPLVTVANRRAWELYSLHKANGWILPGLAYEKQVGESYGPKVNAAVPVQANSNSDDDSDNDRNLQDGSIPQNQSVPIYPDYFYYKPQTQEEIEANAPDFSQGFSRQVFIVPTFDFPDGSSKYIPQVQFRHEVPFYLPGWQHSKIVRQVVNFDLYAYEAFQDSLRATVDSKQAVLSRVTDLGISDAGNPLAAALLEAWETDAGIHSGDPYSVMTFPILRDPMATAADTEIVAVVVVVMFWTSFMDNILSVDAKGILVVIKNGCGQEYTYKVSGPDAVFLDIGDLHGNEFDDMQRTIGVRSDRIGIPLNTDFCPLTIHVYPTKETQEFYETNAPIYYTIVCVCIFVFAIVVFLVYDCLVERRQKLVLKTALDNRAIVASLFPAGVRDRLLHGEQHGPSAPNRLPPGPTSNANVPLDDPSGVEAYSQSNDVLTEANAEIGRASANALTATAPSAPIQAVFSKNPNRKNDQRPIADIYPHTTVYFADIAGFTRWSSQREPTEVFELLQTLYAAFDRIAKRLKVFKIETIGDCYVAVTGLPDPQADHAVIMARFARECVHRMHALVLGLVECLGEDTATLTLRVGVHSGPVTAGVLRGEKSRFQLFGDTVNTASRMESTGQPNHIQCSQATAILLKEEGKDSWLKARAEKVFAKGKGELQTYWIKNRSRQRHGSSGNTVGSISGSQSGLSDDGNHGIEYLSPKLHRRTSGDTSAASTGSCESMERSDVQTSSLDVCASAVPVHSGQIGGEETIKAMPVFPHHVPSMVSLTARRDKCIEWAVGLLADLIKSVVCHRQLNVPPSHTATAQQPRWDGSACLVVDEVTSIIHLSCLDDSRECNGIGTVKNVTLDEAVMVELADYVEKIASMYRDNPFHCFEHACHVAMSTHGLMVQITESYKAQHHQEEGSSNDLAYLGRITSNPVCHFALVFSALVHDVDHAGISNMDLIQNRDEMAELYENKSVAEQNSMDIAWELLMDESYKNLQQVLYTTKSELRLLRQLAVNSIMATDIFDNDAKESREKRWNQAFGSLRTQSQREMSVDDFECLQATLILEHVLQASDAIHAMQHHTVFRKWNERLFEEMQQAYKAKMSLKDPTDGAFEFEVMFFDDHILPLARKLQDCGAFGSSGHELLKYASENRALWAAQASDVVQEMTMRYNKGKT